MVSGEGMEGVGTGRVEAAVEMVQDSPDLLLINWRMSGLLVTMPEPRGKKSLSSHTQS